MKKIPITILILASVTFLSLLTAFSQTSDTITIVTYYPAPRGSYRELRTTKMIIGNPDLSMPPAPDSSGLLRFWGMPYDPSGWSDQYPGTIYYNSNENEFRYHDGSEWKKLGGGTLSPVYTTGQITGNDTSIINMGRHDFCFLTYKQWTIHDNCSHQRHDSNTCEVHLDIHGNWQLRCEIVNGGTAECRARCVDFN